MPMAIRCALESPYRRNAQPRPTRHCAFSAASFGHADKCRPTRLQPSPQAAPDDEAAPEPAWRCKKLNVFALNSSTFSEIGAWAHPSKISSSEFRIAFSRFANRVEVATSWRPNVSKVGAVVRLRCASASWAITAFDCWMKLATDWAGRLRTNSANAWM